MLLRRLLVPVLAVGLLGVAANANAGSLVVRDEAQIFTPGDTEQLRAVVARAPFDARLVTTTSYADQAGFSRFVGTLVSEPDMVVVGLDPQHHHVQVHFGTASHIPESDWPAIERAGNDAFKRGAWEEGGADILRAATTAVSSTGRSTTPAGTPAVNSAGSFLGVGLIVMLVLGVGVAAILFTVFRRRSPGYGAAGYGGAGYGGGPYPGGSPGGQGPYYGPGGAPGGMGPLGGGVIGAGLGGLAGYELGKMEGEREQRGFDQGQGGGFDAGGGGSSTPDNGSFDAGGGGSSWDDSGGGGGGGGDFGGGGGGGGDSGGGGSDF